MAQFPTIKRGDTFAPLLTYTNAGGYPIPLDAISIASQVRGADGSLVANLVVTKLDQVSFPGKYSLSADTSAWPVDQQLEFDIRYVQNGAVAHTDTAVFRVEAPVTVTPP